MPERERERDSSKSLSDDNNSDYWAVLPKRDEACEDRWMAFLQNKPSLLIKRQEVPMEHKALKNSSLSSASQRYSS